MDSNRLAVSWVFIAALQIAFVAKPLSGQMQGAPHTKKELVYIWYPRSTDIPHSDSAPEAVLLKSILGLVTLQNYTVKPGETLDSILIKTFYVSAQFRSAYALYIQRIKALNPTLNDLNKLQPGMVLVLPMGPRYSVTELSSQKIPETARAKAFVTLSAKAYFGPKNQYKAETSALTDKVDKSLGYVFQKTYGEQLTSNQIFAKAKNLGIVPAISLEEHPETALAQAQSLHIEADNTAGQQALLNDLITNETNGGLLPATVPEVTSAAVDCAGHCQKCADILGIPPGTNLSKARILITDTGLNLNLLHNPPVKFLSPQDQSNIADVSVEQHGTFVYSEISSSGDGPIPDSQLYVTRVASSADGGSQFDIASVLAAWTGYSAVEGALRNGEPLTWIANISAEGGSSPGTQPEPAIPYDSHLLVIAAAGNGATSSTSSVEIFPRLSSQNSSLIVVGALNSAGNKASYSNWDRTNVQLFARGDCVCGAGNQLNGTSQAAPLVAVAAATLASVRSDWYSRQVMWRLLSTSDRPAELRDFALSGIVNLPRALSAGIRVRFDSAGSSAVSEISTMEIQFDQEWVDKINSSSVGIDPGINTLLRITDHVRNEANMECFTLIRYLSFSSSRICVSPSAKLSLAGVAQPLSASAVEDVILPMNSDQTGTLPSITATR